MAACWGGHLGQNIPRVRDWHPAVVEAENPDQKGRSVPETSAGHLTRGRFRGPGGLGTEGCGKGGVQRADERASQRQSVGNPARLPSEQVRLGEVVPAVREEQPADGGVQLLQQRVLSSPFRCSFGCVSCIPIL